MNLIQQAVARADHRERTEKLVMTPLEPVPNLGHIGNRSFRPVPLNPGRTPFTAVGLAILALAGGAALYVALAHTRDEAAAVTSAFAQAGIGGSPEAPLRAAVATPAPAPAPAAPAAAVVATAPAAAATPGPAAVDKAAPATAASPADLLLEARYTIDAWARSWSARDVDAYLAYYGQGFAPERGTSRANWEKARRQAIERRGKILVTVSNLQLEAVSGDRVVALYTQDYAADDYRETGTAKRLVLAREGGIWRIVAESAPGAAR